MLLDPEALTPTMVEHGRLKDPVLHVIGFGRALGATIGDPNSFQNVFSNLSQRVLTPATVFSFYQPTAMIPGQTTYFGPEFQLYPPALAIQRANFIYGIITGQYGSAYADRPRPLPGGRRRSGGARRHGEPAADDGPHVEPAAAGADHRHAARCRPRTPTSAPSARIYLAAISSEYSVYGGGFSAGGVIPTNVQSPTGLTAAAHQRQRDHAALEPAGAGPGAHRLSARGQPLAGRADRGALPTGSPAAQFTFAAPTGSFYLRLRAMNGAELSLPSNEIRV